MNLKNLAMWGIIVFLTIGLYNMFKSPQSNPRGGNQIIFSDFLTSVDNGEVVKVEIQGKNIKGVYSNGNSFSTYSPNDPNLIEKLSEKGVSISAAPLEEKMPSLFGVLLSWFPMLLLIAVWIFFMRQMQGGRGGAMGFGKSKAKMMNELKGKVTFNDVAGVEEAKEEVEEIVEFLKDPKKFSRLGGKIPRGALLVGPPGTGKTLLARAIAGEAAVPFFTISGSDFVEMFVGVGASRVRDMFEQGKKNSPCIIFIDEIDAVGRSRGAGLGGGNDEREQTLNQLLVEMDGFDTNEGVIIIAATNRPDVLDPALLRPGRFDRQVVVSNPDIIGREKILKVHVKKIKMAPDVNLRTVARGTPGFSGADLANLVNEAALLAARKNKRIVTLVEFEEAKDKVMMGSERRSMVMTEEEKTLTAYHEAGHAIVTINESAAYPIHKATIIPRGRALGMVMQLPERDELSQTREQLHAQLAIAMGGRVAEEIIFGEDKVTTGASSDIEQATKRARAMVMRAGLSKELGPVAYGENEEEVFLGRSVARQQNMSEETAQKVDSEIRKIVDKGYERARKVLTEKIDDLHKLAKALLTYETLSGEEIENLINKNVYPKDKEDIKVEDNDKGSALSSLGLKPKIVH
ncbi:MAG: cell division protein FtsH [Pelagibacterales bacterium MED-G39]|jgi:cell division protease FtsH|nr:ATP-dependent zinc metalloprotease FtsH [Pelagibacterales bacterium SAG-MED14]PDH18190.1 MAG: cell division protein FtsH [Pelagibacterales bacterium MED-G39]